MLYRPEDFHTVTYGFGTDQGVIAYSVAGAAAWFTGRPDEGIASTGRAVQLGHTLASPISELLARIFKGLVHHLRGESELARSEAEVLSRQRRPTQSPAAPRFRAHPRRCPTCESRPPTPKESRTSKPA